MVTSVSSSTDVNALVNTSSTSKQTDAAAQQDRFLKLLVAQLNNQDPMNPMDNAQMTSQMAQINTVSGIQQLNDTMKSMSTQFSAMQVLQGASLVGKGVLIESNTLTIKDGVAAGAVDLATKADKVTVQVLSPGGQVLDKFELGAQDAGMHGFRWDASTYQGTGAPTFKVTATLKGVAVTNTALAHDTVVAVGSSNGNMTLELAGRNAVAYTDVKSIL
ncbi:flagellar hook assembly protein FlgD [Rhodoferax sp. TS-BS-61-7]|jgi:flagellar basal-body rod modification protein FlgD|uniref:flagellar hook assembly protein FlgD n=1 Tax=Rhodoferax sp. TS-BS-61-7 TaxID=2094194 RepID=UPI000CF65261|nr:flagellar hook assembly protein FlgD [Rhodoferax sp. TS-BS-61-7]PQA77772.1 flagellar biosynthesis protein FlgD [Rhodoferax sp. TS-BS-61-7]